MNICNVLQGVFVRVHIKEEGRWESERRDVCTAPVFIRAHTFYIRHGACVLVVFPAPASCLPAYLHVSRSDTQFICELDTIYRRDTISLCHRVLHTRLLRPFGHITARLSIRPSVRPPFHRFIYPRLLTSPHKQAINLSLSTWHILQLHHAASIGGSHN